MQLNSTILSASVSFLAIIGAAPAVAVELSAGQTLDSSDYFDFGQVLTTDTSWYGANLGMFSDTVNQTRDGFDGFDVVPGLYNVDAELTVNVYDGGIGTTTFAYNFLATDNGFFGDNGALSYKVSGFAGYDVEIGWTFDSFPYVPTIYRSDDGDMITVTYFDPLDALNPIETLLIRANSDSFDLETGAMAGIFLDTFGELETAYGALPTPAPIPLPGTGLALAGGLAALVFARRKSNPS